MKTPNTTPAVSAWRKCASVRREGKFFYCRPSALYSMTHVLQDWHSGKWSVQRNHAPCALGEFETAKQAMRAADASESIKP